MALNPEELAKLKARGYNPDEPRGFFADVDKNLEAFQANIGTPGTGRAESERQRGIANLRQKETTFRELGIDPGDVPGVTDYYTALGIKQGKQPEISPETGGLASLAPAGAPAGTPTASTDAERITAEANALAVPLSGPERRGGLGSDIDTLFASFFAGKQAPPELPPPETRLAEARASSGFGGAQSDLQAAQSDLRNYEAIILSEQDKIKGAPVSSRVIGRQLAKLSADHAENLRQKQKAVADASDRFQASNTTLNTLMQLEQKSYDQARDEYEFGFNKTIQVYNALSGELNRAEDNARANAQMIINSLQKNRGAEVTEVMRTGWNRIELQAGLEPGTIENYALAVPDVEVKWMDEGFDPQGNKVVTFYGLDKEGQPSVVSTHKTGMVKESVDAANPGGYTDQEIRKLRAVGIEPAEVNKADNYLYGVNPVEIELDDAQLDAVATALFAAIPDTFGNVVDLFNHLDQSGVVKIENLDDRGVRFTREQVTKLKAMIESKRSPLQKFFPGRK